MPSCHDGADSRVTLEAGPAPVILVGHPNVGKSVLFGALTGAYAHVANYPGTTVGLTRGTLRGQRGATARPVIDTPGIQSIVPQSEDERVTRDVLLDHPTATVVQVVDTKNLRRGLLVALELAEAAVPFILDLNMADEATARGIHVDADHLASLLGVPVVATVATRGLGMDALLRLIDRPAVGAHRPTYNPAIEDAVARIEPLLPSAPVAARSLALAVLAGDDALLQRLEVGAEARAQIAALRASAEAKLACGAGYAINRRRLEVADGIVAAVVRRVAARQGFGQRAGAWASHPVWGWPILLVALVAMYLFVGVLGAKTLVDLLENGLFGGILNPLATAAVDALVPVPLVRDFLVGRYGLITMALTYGVAIVLPIVATFFVGFSVLEDSGYLPRLAVMLDRAFRVMGLNGKAVLPMILGLGCDTMATVTTRILETRKERVLVTFLLALAVPCSAQLGVVLGMVVGLGPAAVAIWLGVLVGTLVTVGYLAARLLPGEPATFMLELPPMRWPALGNVLVKTAARVEWYLREVIPIFVYGTAGLFVLDALGGLALVEGAAAPLVVGWLGLPSEATPALLIGFLRRDYGAAGLFDLSRAGALSPEQTLVSMLVVTLFMPCIAMLMVITREHGGRTAAAVAGFVFPFALVVGGLAHRVFAGMGWFA